MGGRVGPQAEGEDPTVRVGLSGGLGIGTGAIGGVLMAYGGKGAWDVVGRYAGTSDFEIFGPSDAQEDVALLVGRRFENPKSWARLSAGLGAVRAIRSGPAVECYFFACSYEQDVLRSVGLALQLDGVWAPAPVFGLGLVAFANLNPTASFLGLTLNLHLGNLR